MRSRWFQSSLVVLLAVGALGLTGCCSIARALCPVEQPRDGNTRLTRDTPEDSLDYLIAGIDDRRVADIFDSLHPDFIASYGGFNLAEFTSAFDEFEDAFQADADALRTATRVETRLGPYGASIAVRGGALSGRIIFKRRDVAFVKTTNDFVPESRAVIAPLGTLIRNEDGEIVVGQPVKFAGMDSIEPSEIVRLEYRQEWLIYELREVKGVQLVERINEHFE